MRGFPYSSSRRPRSPLPTNPVLLVSPRASQVSQQPYGSEPVHRLHLPALMRVTSLTPHQDDPVVRYPAITPTKGSPPLGGALPKQHSSNFVFIQRSYPPVSRHRVSP
ncbi:hypothetical protein RGQ29_032054 [Quercus rubra]|uniref:Uncharacterized protein n=1 Tax=Quercus rubra TaxID=3512 RepID=A0AAN7DUJ7_QUERU|nr:hypothetical protein RGQ29_032912 [Quercus rubra]KAK4552141.1 hypothetical protein RGQ29_032176 [Quercus rubra]KAK4552424.1 hypothetical protein RGQ29_032054 [Quercus rubra]